MQIIQRLTEHHAHIVLGDAGTSLLQCVMGLRPALHTLALEAKHPSVRSQSALSLIAGAEQDSSASFSVNDALFDGCSDVLTAAASFTQLRSLSLHSNWCPCPPTRVGEPQCQDRQDRLQGVLSHLFEALGCSLQHIRFECALRPAAGAGMLNAISSLTKLSSIQFFGELAHVAPAEEFCSLVEGFAQLPALRTLQLDSFQFVNISGYRRADHGAFVLLGHVCKSIAKLTTLTSLCMNCSIKMGASRLSEHAHFDVVRSLGIAMKPLNGLESLELIDTLQGYATGSMLNSVLAHKSLLTRLVLECDSYLEIDDSFSDDAWNNPVLSNLKALRELRVLGYSLEAKHASAIAGLNRLSKLELGGNINDAFWEVLGEKVPRMSCLKILNLRGCLLCRFLSRWAGGLHLAAPDAIPQLVKLELQCYSGYDEVTEWDTVLRSVTSLTALVLQFGQFGALQESTIKSLAGSISHMPRLKELSFSLRTGASAGSKLALGEAAARCFGPDWETQAGVQLDV